MKKSLAECISNGVNAQDKMRITKNKVAFLALREDIAEALEVGWSVMVIWETLHEEGKITISYNTFRLYIFQFLNGQKPGFPRKVAIDNSPQKALENRPTNKSEASISSFTFNPKANPDDLL